MYNLALGLVLKTKTRFPKEQSGVREFSNTRREVWGPTNKAAAHLLWYIPEPPERCKDSNIVINRGGGTRVEAPRPQTWLSEYDARNI